MIPLSILDLSPVSAGSTAAQALRNSLDLARLADGLGYTRYWVAEHHNLPSIASSAPDIMIGQIAAVTKNMRVGSGGVMLPNHAPLMVAERFKVLEALFPGRIDLGLGRAPGTDPVTSYALRRRQEDQRRATISSNASRNCMLLETPRLSGRASVQQGARDAVGRAAAADLSARLARLQRAARRRRSAPAFPSRITSPTYDAVDAMRPIASNFKPRARTKAATPSWRSRRCAPTPTEAERLAATVDLNFVRRAQGRVSAAGEPGRGRAPTTTRRSTARASRKTASGCSVGSPDTVRARLAPLIEATKADELMVTTMVTITPAAGTPTSCWQRRSGCCSPPSRQLPAHTRNARMTR